MGERGAVRALRVEHPRLARRLGLVVVVDASACVNSWGISPLP
jgi:hypothetical protein